ncbi:MAG: mannose-1-phosphate guanylyltransferase/mannose-6-phosphate isomerase [Rickettsiales bacterium]|nr:mannose-1-phosphate guanylyltransferase/mannose-6-phosphate isomerase [Rickettsiales bacterium]
MIIPVILCGGVGSRLWPLSRENNPKQFLKIDDNRSLFQKTILRVSDKKIFMNPIIICKESYKFRVASELEEINIKPYAILLEPCSKNTAPAISIAALYIKQQFKNSQPMLVLPSDHVIGDTNKFVSHIKKLKNYSTKGLITFGITPDRPATSYGYIKTGDELENDVFSVKQFIEKPNKSRAEKFLKANNYLWNSGMFLMDNHLYLKELEKINNSMLETAQQTIEASKKVFDFIELDNENFSKFENISIDVAVFEKTKNAFVYPINIKWLDLGSWNGFYQHMKKHSDKKGNVIIGNKISANKCANVLIHSKCNSHLVVNKLENICVINTQDAILITNKENSEDLKTIYTNLKKKDATIVQDSNRCYRPWGYYEVILDSTTCKVKRIFITPHQQISLQYHMKRSEHWVITKGIATVTKGKESLQLTANESIYIPVKEIHKISNNTSDILEFIEVQIGEELIEEDIIRLEDKYGRIKTKTKDKYKTYV